MRFDEIEKILENPHLSTTDIDQDELFRLMSQGVYESYAMSYKAFAIVRKFFRQNLNLPQPPKVLDSKWSHIGDFAEPNAPLYITQHDSSLVIGIANDWEKDLFILRLEKDK